MAIAILRVKDGLDCSHLVGSLFTDTENGMIRNDSQNSLGGGIENPGMELDATDFTGTKVENSNENMFGKKKNKNEEDIIGTGVYRGPDGTEIPKDIVANLSLFQTKQGKGTIDVWWLYDDGIFFDI
jgi:hypothetical protein